MEKDILFEIHGFKVRKDSLYTVQHRPDPDAPTGYQQMGSTKLPSEGVGDTFYAIFKQAEGAALGMGTWDTGFDPLSPCYQGFTSDEALEMSKSRRERVLEPYQKHVGRADEMETSNEKSIESTPFRVWDGRVFRTQNPSDVLHLYFALMCRKLVPTSLEGDTTFNSASFRISDVNRDVKKRDQDSSNKFTAIGEFQKLLMTNKPMLFDVLNYLGMTVAKETGDEALQGIFDQWISNPVNMKTFNMILQDMKKDAGKAKIQLYTILKEKSRKGSEITKTDNGTLFYKEVEIGKDLKSAAGNIAKQSDLEGIKKELLFN